MTQAPFSASADSGSTGSPVAQILDSLRALETLPVAEHVAVYEAVTMRLQAFLADTGRAVEADRDASSPPA